MIFEKHTVKLRSNNHASSLTILKLEPTTPSMWQHVTMGGQMHSTCCAQQYYNMLC